MSEQPITEISLATLRAGAVIAADDTIGSPAGRIVEVEHRTCEDHGEWIEACDNCEVAWRSVFANGVDRWTALPNRHLR